MALEPIRDLGTRNNLNQFPPVGPQGGEQFLPGLGAFHQLLRVGVVAADLDVALVIDGDFQMCPFRHALILPRQVEWQVTRSRQLSV